MKIAVDMVAEGLITRDEAVMRLDPAALDQLLHPTIDPHADRDIIARDFRPRPALPPARSC
jgi:pyruvate,orthophosphate dikinase